MKPSPEPSLDLVRGWLTARSIGRGLAPPVADRGGFRVDTGSDVEAVRWVFPHVTDGLRALADEVREPARFIKLFADAATLRDGLPSRWDVRDSGFVMSTTDEPGTTPLPDGYRVERERDGPTTCVRVHAADGALAASGYGIDAAGFFVYDRIVTDATHRRRGLGRVVMQTLARERSDASVRQLLVATHDGRALYETLGWSIVSPYASASIPAP